MRKLVLVYHLLGSIGQNPFNKMDSNAVIPEKTRQETVLSGMEY